MVAPIQSDKKNLYLLDSPKTAGWQERINLLSRRYNVDTGDSLATAADYTGDNFKKNRPDAIIIRHEMLLEQGAELLLKAAKYHHVPIVVWGAPPSNLRKVNRQYIVENTVNLLNKYNARISDSEKPTLLFEAIDKATKQAKTPPDSGASEAIRKKYIGPKREAPDHFSYTLGGHDLLPRLSSPYSQENSNPAQGKDSTEFKNVSAPEKPEHWREELGTTNKKPQPRDLKTLYLVQDSEDEDQQKQLQRLLKKYRVKLFPSAVSALIQLKEHSAEKPDLILMSQTQDSDEVKGAMIKDAHAAGIPVIAISHDDIKDLTIQKNKADVSVHINDIYRLGADEVVHPEDTQALLYSIRNLLNTRGGPQGGGKPDQQRIL